MNLAVGQIYAHRQTGHEVVVVGLRDEDHPKGHGKGYGITALTAPIQDGQILFTLATVHPFDVDIICEALPSHGPNRWRLVDDRHFDARAGSTVMSLKNGPHPGGDQ